MPKKSHTPVQKYNDPQRIVWRHSLKRGDKLAVGIDLGTKCGYAYAIVRPDKSWEFSPWYMGLWDLSAGRWDSGNISFLRLRKFLYELNPAAIFYEDVKYTPKQAVTRYNASRIIARAATSSELLGAFKHTLVTWAEDNKAYCTGIPIGAIKQRAVGSGRANKEQVLEACNREFSVNFDIETYQTTGADNVADAAFALMCGLDQYGNVL